MNEQNLLATLNSINTWWQGNKVPTTIKKSDQKRKIFYELSKNCLGGNRICAISGPRQVGKTTLMGQLIEYQIEQKVDPKRILYLAGDNTVLLMNANQLLIDCLTVYFKFILNENPESIKERIYVYIDEVQSLENWGKQVKSYYDAYPNIKFIISGSSNTKLYNDAAESLVGRIDFRPVLPMKFREFLEFTMKESDMSKKLQFSTNDLREALKDSLEIGTPRRLYDTLTRIQLGVTPEMPQIRKQLETYLIKGGNPGLLEFKEDFDKAFERIKTDLELTVYKDIHRIFNTRNSSDLMTMLTLLASSSGQKVNYTKIGSAIGIDQRVVKNYLSYTQLLYLVAKSPFFKDNKYRQAEKNNKAYIVDVGHRNALLGKMSLNILNEADFGLVIQTAVFNHASRLRFWLSNKKDYEIFYWEDDYGEVDIIIDLPGHTIPIEVKSRSGEKGVDTIKRFINKNDKKSKWGIIVTKDELRLDNNILFMPLWAFLIMC